MAQGRKASEDTRRFAIPVVFALLSIAAVLYIAFAPQSTPKSAREDGKTPVIDSSLARLAASPQPTERLAAAQWLSNHLSAPSSNQLSALEKVLLSDQDPTVRSAVATAIGDLARTSQAVASNSAGSPRMVEPQLLEILTTAYNNERNASVRRCIVEAAGRLSHAEVAYFLSLAEQDPDPQVREAAAHLRQARDSQLPARQSPYLK